jgi:hypothetical protein
MALEPYKDKAFLYEHYVTKRMNLTDIVKLLEKNYNLKTSPQTVEEKVAIFLLAGRKLQSLQHKRWLREKEWKCESKMILKRKVD